MRMPKKLLSSFKWTDEILERFALSSVITVKFGNLLRSVSCFKLFILLGLIPIMAMLESSRYR